MPVLDPMELPKAERDAARQWLKGRNKYATGFCNHYGQVPACEGTQRPGIKTCPMWDTCPCSCHYNIDKMFKSLGMERTEEQPNPKYVPPVNTFVMPDEPIPVHADALSSDDGTVALVIDEGIAAPMPRAARIASLPPTPSGRRHRGQLEYDVLDICERWLADDSMGPDICTPKWVAETIASEQKVPTPSTGAIQAVWDRWEKLGIAKQAKKPARFEDWTGGFNGTAAMLDKLKASKKRQEKSARSAQKRGLLR